MATVRPFLLRRGTTTAPTGGSFKRRSLKLRRGTKEGKDLEADCKYLTFQSCNINGRDIQFFSCSVYVVFPAVRRTESIQRKVSSISDRSDTSEPGAASGGEESPGILR